MEKFILEMELSPSELAMQLMHWAAMAPYDCEKTYQLLIDMIVFLDGCMCDHNFTNALKGAINKL